MIETADILISADEPVYAMQVFEDASGFCTRLIIERGDLPVGLVIHHGPDAEYSGKIPPLYVGGGGTADEMLAESERHRQDLTHWDRAMRMKAESTLIADVIRQEAEGLEWKTNRSVFGPHQTTMRNGYPHEQVVRDWFDERDARTGQTKVFT